MNLTTTTPAEGVRAEASEAFTEVHLEYCSNRRHRLLFGAPFDIVDMDLPRPPGGRIAFFRPEARFGLALWDVSDAGATHWRVLVCRALRAGETGRRLSPVRPGADVLLDAQGATRARAALVWLGPYVESGEAMTLPEARIREMDFRLKNTPRVRLQAYLRGHS